MVTLKISEQEGSVSVETTQQAVNFIQALSSLRQIKTIGELGSIVQVKQVCDLFSLDLNHFTLVGDEMAISKGSTGTTYFKYMPNLPNGYEHSPVVCLVNANGYDVLDAKDILVQNEIIPLVHTPIMLNPDSVQDINEELLTIFRLINTNQFIVLLAEDEYVASFYADRLNESLINSYPESAMVLAEVDESAEEMDIRVLHNFKNKKYGDLNNIQNTVECSSLFE